MTVNNGKITLVLAAFDEFDGIYDALEENFIPEERRDRSWARALANEGKYLIYHITDGDMRVGFITVWELCGFVYVEHFVVYKEFRNFGYGGRALDSLKGLYGSIVLEAEPPSEGIPARRIGFYQRNGFYLNEQYYYQPSYRKGQSGVELKLMSYPSLLEDFQGTVNEIYMNVYNKSIKGEQQ